MRVSVELFGIPRRRAGVARVEIELPTRTASVADVLERLVAMHPALIDNDLLVVDSTADAGETSDDRPKRHGPRVATHCLLQVHGTFTRETSLELQDGDQILLLSADAGG